MAQSGVIQQQRRDWRKNAWYVGLMSLSMVIAHGGYFWLASLLLYPPQSDSSSTTQHLFFLQGLMLLLLFLVFFLANLLRARVTGEILRGVLLGCYACMIGGSLWSVGVSPWESRAVFGDQVGLDLLIYGVFGPALWGIAQVLVPLAGACLGGLVGSRFLSQRPSQESTR